MNSSHQNTRYLQGKSHDLVIILLGPTGVGKTGVSVLLAKALDTEIISADSMQVYRAMDIGTAKPSRQELEAVKHHLVDMLFPHESFSAGMFRKIATDIIDGLHKTGKIPVVVGGTGLYIKTLTKGLFEGPGADWSLREELSEKERHHGRGYLYRYLQEIDPVSARKINSNDTRRIIRALEVWLKSQSTISEFQHVSSRYDPRYYNFVKIGLSRERKELYTLIERRVDNMIEKGLLQETERLLKMNPHKIPLQALGYKEMQLYLNGSLAMEDAIGLLKKRTKMYAKRQLTWFRKEPDVHWVDVAGLKGADEIFTKILDQVEILKELLYVNAACTKESLKTWNEEE